jgi:hypothetical protein
MASMVHNLLSAINEHTLNVFSGRYDTNPITVDESIWCGDNIFLQGWVDFTALCGVGYMLSDNTVGIYFNDTITMTSHDDLEFYYTYRNENNAPQEGIFDLNHVPPKFKDGAHIKRDVSKKISFLGDMRKYMKSNLAMASLEHHNDTQVTTGIHLTKYIVTDDAIIFRLNNGVIQVKIQAWIRDFFVSFFFLLNLFD